MPLPKQVGEFTQGHLEEWLWPSLGLAVWLVTANFAGPRLLGWLGARAMKSETQLDDALVAGVRRAFGLLVLLVGLNLWAGLVPIAGEIRRHVDTATAAGAVFMLVLFVDAFLRTWMAARARTSRVLATSGKVLSTALRVVFYAIGLVLGLATLGVNVTPVLASLGLGSIAIGLALQKTLEDFLSGLQLAADQAIRVGDYVALDAGHEGTVISIGWRTTQIETRLDTHIIVPNSKLAQATVVNRSLTDSEMNVKVPVGVHYQSDLDQVVRVTVEVASQIQATAASAAPGFQCRVQCTAFGDNSVDLVAWLRAKSWEDSFDLQDCFIRALHRRYAEVGIVIPFPIRTIDLPPEVREYFRSRAGVGPAGHREDRSPSGTSA